MFRGLLLITLLLVSNTVQAYKYKVVKREPLSISLSFFTNQEAQSIQFALLKSWSFLKRKRWHVAIGPRGAFNLGNKNINYITAPPSITTGKTGFASYASNRKSENMDTLFLNNTRIITLNFMLRLTYQMSDRFSIEAHTDLFGFSFGAEKQGLLYFGDDGLYSSVYTKAKPASSNLMLPSQHAFGTVCAGFGLRYQLTLNWKISSGISVLYTEYHVQNPVNYINSLDVNVNTERYRSRSVLWGVSLSKCL